MRGHWFPSIVSALEKRGVEAEIAAHLPVTTRHILRSADPAGWYDEGHTLAIFQEIARQHGPAATRELARDAARFAMFGPWRDLMAALVLLLGGTPRMAFEQLPVLWSASRRDAGTLRCVASSARHAVTELSGFALAADATWAEVWLGHHDALLRHLRFGGQAALEAVDGPSGVVRVRTSFGPPIAGAPPTNDGRSSGG